MGLEDETKGGDTEGNKKEENEQIIVLKVDMHCDACAKKVVKSLKTFQGVDDVAVDRKSNTIAVKGDVKDPLKLCDRIHSKIGRNALLISPLPKPKPTGPDDPPKDDKVKDHKDEDNKHKDQAPAVVTVVLRVQMHCEACGQHLRKRIRKVKGVESVETNVGKGEVTVKGVIPDAEEMAKYVRKKTRKQVSVVKDEEKKQEKEEVVKEEEEKESDNKSKKDEEEEEIVTGGEVNKYEHYWPISTGSRYNYMEHHKYYINYEPHYFSDDNPNACSLM